MYVKRCFLCNYNGYSNWFLNTEDQIISGQKEYANYIKLTWEKTREWQVTDVLPSLMLYCSNLLKDEKKFSWSCSWIRVQSWPEPKMHQIIPHPRKPPTYPSPNPTSFYLLSLRGKCWIRGGVGGGGFPETWNDLIIYCHLSHTCTWCHTELCDTRSPKTQH